MTDPVLLVDRTDPRVAVLTLNRPDRRNALSVDLLLALRAAVEELSSAPDRRVLILRGAGPAFCAGLDFREALDPSKSHASAEALAGLYAALCGSPLVTVAAAHGGAFGGGAGLVAACDLAVAGDDLQLGFPEVRRGLVPALVACLLRRQVPGRRLREMLLLGQPVSAHQALDAGLVNRVVPVASLMTETLALAATVCDGAPGALARTKQLLDDLDGLQSNLTTALNAHVRSRDTPEAREGIVAFFQNRPPPGTGR